MQETQAAAVCLRCEVALIYVRRYNAIAKTERIGIVAGSTFVI
jgi:hypothetical protein